MYATNLLFAIVGMAILLLLGLNVRAVRLEPQRNVPLQGFVRKGSCLRASGVGPKKVLSGDHRGRSPPSSVRLNVKTLSPSGRIVAVRCSWR